eukprot:TRINITY_DN23033_c0_g5_i1.p1 TRINITY_DN23033_c0_g5~~TRINITY_DN23033_c0_g5_i1.p1  ORF type:complete len:534 (+),score=80.65 TRINITY_DN23033_c0_g5_i1:146-1747(+)
MGAHPANGLITEGEKQKRRTQQQAKWSPLRRQVVKTATSSCFDVCINTVLMANAVILVAETNYSRTYGSPVWMSAVNYMFLGVYTLEICARIFVDEASFFHSRMNLFDFILVATDLVLQIVVATLSSAIPSVSVLRLVKLLRLLRTLRALSGFHELWLMLHGLVSAMKALAWACLLVGIVLLIWSVLSVEIFDDIVQNPEFQINEDECPHCRKAFESVQASMLTWFCVVFTGDFWMDLLVPLLKDQPWTLVFIFPSFFIIQFGMLNLILTVIVDRASEARAEDHMYTTVQKKQDFDKVNELFRNWCVAMDKDQDGTITFDELMRWFDGFEDFRCTMNAMDVQREDMSTVFSILDQDGSGSVEYEEFISQLHVMKTQESHTLLIFIKYHIQTMLAKVEKQVSMMSTLFETQSVRQDAEIQEIRQTVMRNHGETFARLSQLAPCNAPTMRTSTNQLEKNLPDSLLQPDAAEVSLLTNSFDEAMPDARVQTDRSAASPDAIDLLGFRGHESATFVERPEGIMDPSKKDHGAAPITL